VVNTVDHENREQQPAKQKEKRSFCRPANAEKWCEIHHISWHDLEECKTILDRKKMQEKSIAQESWWGEHHRADPDNDD
jgi:hypothetical protein